MTAAGPRPIGVVCDDRPAVRRVVTALLVRSGFDVAGEAASFADLRRLVAAERPAVAVLTLPLTGMTGLAAVRALRAEVPCCEIVVLSAFDQLHVAAVEAGATALVPEDSPRALWNVLVDVAARTRQSRVSVPCPRVQPVVVAGADTAPEASTAG